MPSFDNLIVEGVHYSKDALIRNANHFTKQSDWEADFWHFIQKWLSPSPTIEVKTSGSTGRPKMILLEKERMVNSAKMTGAFFNLRARQKVLLPLSTNYIAGKMMVVRAFVLGLDIFPIEPSSNPLKDAVGQFDFVPLVPMQVFNALKTPEVFGKVQKILIGGGPVSSSLIKEIQKLPSLFYHSFGMTETISHIAIRALNGPNASEVYQALSNVHFEVDDRQCLIINAPHITLESLATNDVVELQSEKSFRWLGRYDNVINSGGIKLFPEDLEKKIESLIPARFYLTREPDIKLGQRLVLVLEDAPWPSFKQEDFLKKLKETLPKHQAPKRIIFLQKFKETQTGKVIRKVE